MTDDDRDKLIIEMHQDIRWLKAFNIEHKATHAKYIYYFLTVFVACILSWFK